METRELVEADLPALLDLCQRALPLDQFSLRLLRRRVLLEPDHNPAYQLSLWDGGRLVGAMLGGTRETVTGPVGALRLFAIDPEYRRRGLASRLLMELEGRLRAAGLTRLRVGNIAPSYFWPGLDVRYTPAFCLLQRHGFQRTGEAIDMDVDLLAHDWDTSPLEARLAEDGYTVRRLLPDDHEAFAAWLDRVWSPVWQWEALSTYENEPISTFVALKDGRICAFASYNAAAFENGFGPTGTEPELQGRGLGRVLFHRCMHDLRLQGYRTCEIIWTGPIAFYARVADAVISRVFWFLEKELGV